MSTWAPINYRDYWDQPRIFLVDFRDRHFLFDCAFDEEAEDYPDQYKVYLMPPLTGEDLAGSWANFSARAIQYVGEVPLDGVHFDLSKRNEIDTAILEELLAPVRAQ